MPASPFDSTLWGKLFAEPDIAPLFADTAEIRAILLFEGALAEAQAEEGLIPEPAAAAIARAAQDITLDPAALAAGTGAAGVPVPTLVGAFRKAIGDADAAQWVHFGATSQDAMDTGLVLRLRRAADILDGRLDALLTALASQAERHRTTPMAGRTRHQNAAPTSLGARIAAWGWPLLRHRARLREIRPRVEVMALGGATGTLSVMGDTGPAVVEALARRLGLGAPPAPWHTGRDALAEIGHWAALLTAATGKIGTDLLFHTATDIGEIRAGTPGGSSTMPNKQNPVGAETLVQLARVNATQTATLHHALIHAQDRDGAAWGQEWFALPQMLIAAGAALTTATGLIKTLEADPAALARPLTAQQGTLFAEAASFALAQHMPRPEAQALVKTACAEALASGTPLKTLLAAGDAPVDWDRVFDPARNLGAAPIFADRFIAAVGGSEPAG